MSVTAASAECRFVNLKDDTVSVSFEQNDALLSIRGKTHRYSTGSVGTGMDRRVAYPMEPDEFEKGGTPFEVHEFDGHTFLTWGADLLVERCQ
ncbi:hypothetical protein [Aurantimonas sp. A3-2-R12]|uniref:hypothetical protein n=1 Tax=Aurantimonas sp. A3-2-R12 TaxID=3114362 RepID=UPI002E19F858|nr:hypothetical protein [Aurantimonas sp. A3-2-R12]